MHVRCLHLIKGGGREGLHIWPLQEPPPEVLRCSRHLPVHRQCRQACCMTASCPVPTSWKNDHMLRLNDSIPVAHLHMTPYGTPDVPDTACLLPSLHGFRCKMWRHTAHLRLLAHDLRDPHPVDHLLLRHLQQCSVLGVLSRRRLRVRVAAPRQRPVIPVVPTQQQLLDLRRACRKISGASFLACERSCACCTATPAPSQLQLIVQQELSCVSFASGMS